MEMVSVLCQAGTEYLNISWIQFMLQSYKMGYVDKYSDGQMRRSQFYPMLYHVRFVVEVAVVG